MLIFMVTVFILKGVCSLTVQFFSDKDGILGPSDLRLTCIYNASSREKVLGINIMSSINNSLIDIASFDPNLNKGDSHLLFPAADYLLNRVNLTLSSNNATITFNEIQCEDETQYQCKIVYRSISGQYTNVFSEITEIVVKGGPAAPDFKPTWQPANWIEEGTFVTFTCTGNVGKPAGRFKWTKSRRSELPVNYSSMTTLVEMPGTCTFNGTSSMSVKIEAEDNHASVRCEVEHELATADMYRQTDAEDFDVYYGVRDVQIVGPPKLIVGLESLIPFACLSDGNPPPTYVWYRDRCTHVSHIDMDTLSTTNILFLSPVACNIGVYTCVANNSINGTHYEMVAKKLVLIENTTISTTSATTIDSINEDSQRPCTNTQEQFEPSLAGVITFFLLLQMAEVSIAFVLYKKGRLIFKSENKNVYEVSITEGEDSTYYNEIDVPNQNTYENKSYELQTIQ